MKTATGYCGKKTPIFIEHKKALCGSFTQALNKLPIAFAYGIINYQQRVCIDLHF